jgi:hypothetical protein
MVAMIRSMRQVGHSAVSTPHSRILLKNVLHVLQATRNLASVHRLTTDNDVFLDLHPTFFSYQGSVHEANPSAQAM